VRARTATARLSHGNSACLSVCLSHEWISQKIVQAKITKSLLSAAWKTLLSKSVKLFYKFERGHLEWRC